MASTIDVHMDHVTVDHSQAVTLFSAQNTSRLTVGDLELAVNNPDAVADPMPCARVENTDGVIDALAVRWAAAPPAWQPMIAAGSAECNPASPALVVKTLTVEPSELANRVVPC